MHPTLGPQGGTSRANVTVITFTPDPVRDVDNVIARELEGLTAGLGDQHLLLDFTNVDVLNSMELGTLINLHKQFRDAGGRLTLFNLSTDVFSLFTISHLDTLLQICRERWSRAPNFLRSRRLRDRTSAIVTARRK